LSLRESIGSHTDQRQLSSQTTESHEDRQHLSQQIFENKRSLSDAPAAVS
jgi:hypothetical protein